MANRRWVQFIYSFVRQLVTLQGSAVLASGTGGVTSFAMPGVASITRTGVGQITVVLQDSYNSFLFGGATLLAGTAQNLVPQISSANVTPASKTIVINLLAAGVATDPSAGCTLYIHFLLNNSSVVK